jgi:hypothetical protein
MPDEEWLATVERLNDWSLPATARFAGLSEVTPEACGLVRGRWDWIEAFLVGSGVSVFRLEGPRKQDLAVTFGGRSTVHAFVVMGAMEADVLAHECGHVAWQVADGEACAKAADGMIAFGDALWRRTEADAASELPDAGRSAAATLRRKREVLELPHANDPDLDLRRLPWFASFARMADELRGGDQVGRAKCMAPGYAMVLSETRRRGLECRLNEDGMSLTETEAAANFVEASVTDGAYAEVAGGLLSGAVAKLERLRAAADRAVSAAVAGRFPLSYAQRRNFLMHAVRWGSAIRGEPCLLPMSGHEFRRIDALIRSYGLDGLVGPRLAVAAGLKELLAVGLR